MNNESRKAAQDITEEMGNRLEAGDYEGAFNIAFALLFKMAEVKE